jgi:hypothetical protein
LEIGFPASNASSFLARAKRSLRVGFAFADLLRFAFLGPTEGTPRRFNFCFFFAIGLSLTCFIYIIKHNATAQTVLL